MILQRRQDKPRSRHAMQSTGFAALSLEAMGEIS
jgi:hypothetical protein